MQRSSDSIAKLATALAKAQIELVNPEKTLAATIYPRDAGREGRSFNYASLASGLDIIRKTLGQHGIATVQTTAIDQTARTVNLTTILAHASGEWMASEWPVCAVSDTAVPHRMGAALTYARRYALFTLVGIAGEDDLDAPDLQTTPSSQNADRASDPEKPKHPGNGYLNGGQTASSPYDHRNGPPQPRSRPAPRAVLAAEASAALRERLMAEIGTLSAADDAALWAHRSLPEKNTLCADDAKVLEEAFAARLTGFGTILATESGDSPDPSVCPPAGVLAPSVPSSREEEKGEVSTLARPADQFPSPATTETNARQRGTRPAPSPVTARAQRLTGTSKKPRSRVDKSALSLPEPRRIRDRDHVRYVAQQACLVCGRVPCDAHHLRFTQSRALGRKVSDEFTVPLCRGHHRELHRCGDETGWWRRLEIDPTVSARSLWLEGHPLPFSPNGGDADKPLRRVRESGPATESAVVNPPFVG